jgi:hypothetical protein
MARLLSVITEAGKSAYSLPANTSANRWLAAIVTGSPDPHLSKTMAASLSRCAFVQPRKARRVG